MDGEEALSRLKQGFDSPRGRQSKFQPLILLHFLSFTVPLP
jgi:hypothetical protein